MNLFEAMGIKEVADVTFYNTVTNAPALHLDTLKVSTMETTAEQTAAKGGKGNSPLVIWDFGKEINVSLEDALFSMKSLAMMTGGRNGKQEKVDRSARFKAVNDGSIPPEKEIPDIAQIYDTNEKVVDVSAVVAGEIYIATWTEIIPGGADTITINAESFPGTYRVVGITYARNQDGVDEFFQFVIPRAKMASDNTINMQAEGDPSTFNMNLRVMRPEDGQMMKLIKFPKKEATPVIDVGGVTISDPTSAMSVNDVVQLNATVSPADATTQNVIWSSSVPSVATVDNTGKVTAIGIGTTNIIVTTVDGGYNDKCVVTVS